MINCTVCLLIYRSFTIMFNDHVLSFCFNHGFLIMFVVIMFFIYNVFNFVISMGAKKHSDRCESPGIITCLYK